MEPFGKAAENPPDPHVAKTRDELPELRASAVPFPTWPRHSQGVVCKGSISQTVWIPSLEPPSVMPTFGDGPNSQVENWTAS